MGSPMGKGMKIGLLSLSIILNIKKAQNEMFHAFGINLILFNQNILSFFQKNFYRWSRVWG